MESTLEALQKDINYHKTNNCVQCGYCLPVCPTYLTMKKETHSPRGRINLVKMVGEGAITDLSALEEPINLCLGCRACETACPTGVEYGSILESVKATLLKHKKLSRPARLMRDTLFRKVFPNRNIMRTTGNAYWLYEKTGLQKTMRKTGILDKLPANLGTFESIMPPAASPSDRKRNKGLVEAKGEQKYKVAFFTGCIMDAMFHRINELSVKLLAEAGCEVTIMESQTCCGALQAHSGEIESSKLLAKQNIAAFEQIDADFIVNNAGGCGAALIEYPHLLEEETEWHDRAKRFASKTKDISQVLAACGGFSGLRHRNGERVTYQRSCHMTNVQKVTEEPVQLLKSIPGIHYIEMENPNMCCGSAGIYNIVNYDASMDILNLKMEYAKNTKAAVIITTNPGCLLQMKLGIKREGLDETVRALHLIEYLAEVYEFAEDCTA